MTGTAMVLALWAHAAGSFGPATVGESGTVAVWDAQTQQFVVPPEVARAVLEQAVRVKTEAAARVVEEPAARPAGGFRVRLKGAIARSAFVAAVKASGEVAAGCEGGAPSRAGVSKNL